MELIEQVRILDDLRQRLIHATDGLSAGEIVDIYGVSRNLVPKYIGILEAIGVPIYTERKRYYVDETYRFQAPLTLTPEESELLNLALEPLASSYTGQWKIIRSLVGKLTPHMPTILGLTLNSRFDADSPERPSDRWFIDLSRAKQHRYEVWIDYLPLNRAEPSRWLVRPFQFIGNRWSDGFYLHCEGSQNGVNYVPLSLKFDRILAVEITAERFELTDLVRNTARAGRTWGVWHSDAPSVRVVLQFEPRHYDRLIESFWHETQHITRDNDDYVYFTVDVAEPNEMVAWIRSWGAGVVVLEPETLRQRIIRGLQRQMQAYGIALGATAETLSALNYLWAKYDRRTGRYHLLIYHLLDVAAVAWVMWAQVVSSSQRQWVAETLGLDEDRAGRLLAFWTGVHDIGKATPAFQKKAPSLYEELEAIGMGENPHHIIDKAHGVFSAVILKDYFVESGMETPDARRLAAAIGGHHGAWITSTAMNKLHRGGNTWQQAQVELLTLVQETLAISTIALPNDDFERMQSLITFISGFVSVCDWIGSQDLYFPYETTPIPPEDYFAQSCAQATTALAELGWSSWKVPGNTLPFETVFAFEANPLQQSAVNVFAAAQTDEPPRLILIEYLTGGGKTELALYLADILVNLFRLTGVYVAMPAQATSNQMFGRVHAYLNNRYPHEPINLQLIHGEASYHPLYQQLTPSPNREGHEDGPVAAHWFQGKKRALLAPYAVGTIDQAMLSVLQVKHHFVRQFALSQKVVIFDEIHSYDTYMNAIIGRLMTWLEALNAPMILLSATLSQPDRQQLLRAVGGQLPETDVPYPRLTMVAPSGAVHVVPLPRPETRTVSLVQIPSDLAALAEWLVLLYQQGGCIAIICNTVNEAIEVARHLTETPDIDPAEVLVFHARFPAVWRSRLEAHVLEAFGKNGNRPQRAILVATQIVEQSLDLDFDLMVTCTAPIDLLIQRAGRLHRHPRPTRPAHLLTPTLAIRTPLHVGDVPDFGVDGIVYARFILLKTWLILRERLQLHIPDEIDAVMDFVYDSNPTVPDIEESYQAALAQAYQELGLNDRRSTFRGQQYLIPAPDDEDLIGSNNAELPDDEHLNIATRDIRAGIDLICLGTDGLYPDLPHRPPTSDEVQALLRYKITVRQRDVLDDLRILPAHPHWERIPQLRDARPVIFENHIFAIPASDYLLRLSPFYGLEIVRREDA